VGHNEIKAETKSEYATRHGCFTAIATFIVCWVIASIYTGDVSFGGFIFATLSASFAFVFMQTWCFLMPRR
jgi:hypothetical protein